MMKTLAVLTERRLATDTQTDGQTDKSEGCLVFFSADFSVTIIFLCLIHFFSFSNSFSYFSFSVTLRATVNLNISITAEKPI